jgi:hypothetical protein
LQNNKYELSRKRNRWNANKKNGNQGSLQRILWIAAAVLLVVGFVVFYHAQVAVPFMMDDIWYSTRLYDEQPIRTLTDIVRAQEWHYHNWGGRSITHTILQLTLLLGEQGADLLNTIVFGLLCFLVMKLAKVKGLYFYLGAMCLLIGCNANWEMSMFWQAGAANYLYITVVLLLYMEVFLWEGSERSCQMLCGKRFYPFFCVGMIPLGLLAGWSNENMGPALWLISLAVIILRMRETKKIPLYMILGNLTCLVGSIFLITAPGNFVRISEAVDTQKGVLWQAYLRGYAQSTAAFSYLFPILLILLTLIAFAKGGLGLSLGRRNVLLLWSALLSWGAMVLSPHYPDRASFGTMVLLSCVILSLADQIVRAKPDMRKWLLLSTAFLWLRSMYLLGEFLGISWGWIV